MGASFKLTDAIDESIVRKLKQIGEQSESTATSYAKLVEQMTQIQRFNPNGLDELQVKAAKYNETAQRLRETQSKLNELQKQQSELYKKVAKDIESQVKAQTDKAKLDGQLLANEQKRLRNQQLMEKQNRRAAASEEDITRALNEQAKTMREASEQNRILRQAMRDVDLTAADSAQKMELYNRKIMENEGLLDKNSDAMIQRKRNIGNYASAWDGLGVSIQQMARELPSLTMGVNTFFLAISNNLPILVDELSRARKEFKAMKEAGERATPVWQQVFKSLISWQTALVAGITVLSMYGKEIFEWAKSLFQGEEAVNALADAEERLHNARVEGAKNSAKERAELTTLYNVTQDANRATSERVLAAQRLREMYPSYFGNLSTEEIMLGKAAENYNNLSEAIVKNAKARAIQEEITKLAAEQLEAETKMQEQLRKQDELRLISDSGTKKHSATFFGMRRLTEEAKAYNLAGQEAAKYQAQMDQIGVKMDALAKRVDVKDFLFNEKDVNNAAEEAKDILAVEKQLRDSRIALIDDELQRELMALKAAFDDKIAAVKGNGEKENEIRLNLQREFEEEVMRVQTEYAEKAAYEEERQAAILEQVRKKNLSKELSSIENVYASKSVESTSKVQQSLKEASDLYAKGLITQEEYEKKKYEITKDYGLEQAQLALDMLNEQLDNEKLTTEEREEIRRKIADAELALNDEIVASNEEAAERTREEWEKISGVFADFASQADEMVQGLGSVFQGIFDIFKEMADGGKISVENVLQSISAIAQGVSEVVSGIYESQIEELEKQEEANEESKGKELARIEELAERGAISEEEAEARKRAAEDRTAKKNEEIARKKAALQTKQAKLEKAANIISTIMNTAVAVMKAWSQGGMFGAPMAAMIAAMGAIQLATIISQPIPKYAKGTKWHKGGLAWVGDGGFSETVITRNGMYLTPDTPTLVDLPKGAKVLPYAIDMEYMKTKANDLEGLMAYRKENELPPITIENDYSGLQKDIKNLEASQRKGFKELAKAIRIQDYKRFASSI